jgi:hypothetical protein
VKGSIGCAFGRTTAPTILRRLVASREVRQDGSRYFAVLADKHALVGPAASAWRPMPTSGLRQQSVRASTGLRRRPR